MQFFFPTKLKLFLFYSVSQIFYLLCEKHCARCRRIERWKRDYFLPPGIISLMKRIEIFLEYILLVSTFFKRAYRTFLWWLRVIIMNISFVLGHMTGTVVVRKQWGIETKGYWSQKLTKNLPSAFLNWVDVQMDGWTGRWTEQQTHRQKYPWCQLTFLSFPVFPIYVWTKVLLLWQMCFGQV